MQRIVTRFEDHGFSLDVVERTNHRYQVVRTFARRNGITFVLPGRVYGELTVNAPDVETPPIDTAIKEDLARIAAPLEYTHGLVSRTIDGA